MRRLRAAAAAVALVICASAHAGPPGPVSGEFRFHQLQGWSFEDMEVIPEVRRAKDADVWFESGAGSRRGTHPSVTLTAAGGIMRLSDAVGTDELAPRPVHLFEAVLAADADALRLSASATANVDDPETEVFVVRTRRGGWARLAIVGRGTTNLGARTWPVTVRYTFNASEPRFGATRPDATWIEGLQLAPAAVPRGNVPTSPEVSAVGHDAAECDTWESFLDDAKIHAREGHGVAAGARFGDAAALAQKASDLVAENEVADAFEDFVQRERSRASFPNDAGSTVRFLVVPMSLLSAAMERLDATHRGAFVSAPVLARCVLQLATESGDFACVPAAARVATRHAGGSGSGKAAATTARYAQGMRSVAERDWIAAIEPLGAAFAEASAHEWFDLAAHAGTELAIAHWSAGQEQEARRTLRAVATMLERPRPRRFFQEWRILCVKTRLPDPDHPLRKYIDGIVSVSGRYGGADDGYGIGEPGMGAGRGGRGGEGERVPDETSDIGFVFPKLAATKPIVTVSRTPAGFEIEWGTKSGEKAVRTIDDRLLNVDEGGVTRTFQACSVTLRILDLEGRRGQPGNSVGPRLPDPGRAFYLLAEGETWSVARNGSVTIRSR